MMNTKVKVLPSSFGFQGADSRATTSMYRLCKYDFQHSGSVYAFVCAETLADLPIVEQTVGQLEALLHLSFSNYEPSSDRNSKQLVALLRKIFADLTECTDAPQKISVSLLYWRGDLAICANIGEAVVCIQAEDGFIFQSTAHNTDNGRELEPLIRIKNEGDETDPDRPSYDCHTRMLCNRTGDYYQGTMLTRGIGGSKFPWLGHDPELQLLKVDEGSWACFGNYSLLEIAEKAGLHDTPVASAREMISRYIKAGVNAKYMIKALTEGAGTSLEHLSNVTLSAFIRGFE